jgi:hypothetical protein
MPFVNKTGWLLADLLKPTPISGADALRCQTPRRPLLQSSESNNSG